MRATVSDMGPLLLARMLNLNETQAGVLQLVFKIADDQRPAAARPEGPAGDAAVRRRERQASSPPSTATSARPASAPSSAGCCRSKHRAATSSSASRCSTSQDFMQTDRRGHGVVNILAADKLMQLAAAVRHVPAVDAVRAVRAAAGGRRPRQAQARVLLRRGAPAVRRRAEGAGRAHRAGRAAGPLQGRRRVLRDAEPAGHSRQRAGASWATGCSTRCGRSRRATRRR